MEFVLSLQRSNLIFFSRIWSFLFQSTVEFFHRVNAVELGHDGFTLRASPYYAEASSISRLASLFKVGMMEFRFTLIRLKCGTMMNT